MGLIKLAVYKGKGQLFNWLIRTWSRSPYSHCELLMPDGTCLSASAMDGGVRAKRIELDHQHWDFYPLPWADEAAIMRLFEQHQGKGYDWPGIFFSQLLASGVHSGKRMFCSEFCAAALGLPHAQRYNPAMLAGLAWRISNPISTGQQDTTNMPDRPETWAFFATWLEQNFPALYAGLLAALISGWRIIYGGGRFRQLALEAPLCGLLGVGVFYVPSLIGAPAQAGVFFSCMVGLFGVEASRAAAARLLKKKVDL